MVMEEVRRDGKTWRFVYGYGRIQRIRAIYTEHLPQEAKRLLVNPASTEADIVAKLGPDELSRYNEAVGKAILKTVLQSASDWDGKDPEAYIDTELPEDVGNEIISRVQAAIGQSSLTTEAKKN